MAIQNNVIIYPDRTASLDLVKGNSPLQLNTTSTFRLIKSGSMAVFAVKMANGVPTGGRHYLFDANPGDALFGVTTNTKGTSYQLLAIPYEDSEMFELEIASLTSDVGTSDDLIKPDIPPLIQTWNNCLVDFCVDAQIELAGIESEEFNTPVIVDRLNRFHANFLVTLDQLYQQQDAERANQFDRRLKLNEQVTDRSFDNLTAIFRPKAEAFLTEGTALLVAAGAVGKALGIEIHPPARSEDPTRVKDPLDAISRASRIRTRRVILSEQWWKSDCGPILAYTAEGEHPIALLPAGSNGYEIFEPEGRERTPVTTATAKSISPIAFTFYRPFPERTLKTLDILLFAIRGRTWDIITLLAMGIIVSLLEMVVPQATGILIDSAIPDANRGLIWQIAMGLMAVTAGKIGFQLIQAIATARLQALTNLDTQTAIWDRLLKLRVSFFRKYSTGDLQSRVSAISQIHHILSGSVLTTIFHAFFSFLNLGLLFTYSPQLALVALAVATVNIIVTNVAGILSRKKMRPMEEIQGDLFGLIVQLIGGVSKLYVSGAEERAFAYWSKKFTHQLQLMLSTEAIENGVSFFNTILPTVSSMLIYWVVVGLIAQAHDQGGTGFSTGTFLAFNAAFGTFISGATSLSNTIMHVLEVSVLWERAKPILSEQPEIDLDKSDPGRLSGGIKLDRVSFRYSQDTPLTLDKVTIEAKAGEFIALVGPSGSGKSTTVRLILGFEEIEEGSIYYDGQDLSGLDISAIRRQLGVVLQNGRINSASIFENISSGALVTMDEAWEAARMAGFGEDVENMPMGMHTVISEGGTNLSGGQRQRLLIARALVLKPKILIFDEATSALDNRTQAIVSASLEQLKVTRIVIAHRLSTIRNADRIYVLAGGQVLQQGNYDELMSQTGMFADLMARQVA